MIIKSYLFFVLSVIVLGVIILLAYLIPPDINNNVYFLPVFMRIPSIVLNAIGIYYGVKGIMKYKLSLRTVGAIGAIFLNTIFLISRII